LVTFEHLGGKIKSREQPWQGGTDLRVPALLVRLLRGRHAKP
jgi:hypothetical protein